MSSLSCPVPIGVCAAPQNRGGQPQKNRTQPPAVPKGTGCRCHPGGHTHSSSCRGSSTNHGPLALADPTLTPLFFWGGETRRKHARRSPRPWCNAGCRQPSPSTNPVVWARNPVQVKPVEHLRAPKPWLNARNYFFPPPFQGLHLDNFALGVVPGEGNPRAPRAQPPANALGSLLGGSSPVLWSCEAKSVLLKCLRWVLGVPQVSWPWCRAPAPRPRPHPCPLAQRGRGAGTGAFPAPTPWGVPPAGCSARQGSRGVPSQHPAPWSTQTADIGWWGPPGIFLGI